MSSVGFKMSAKSLSNIIKDMWFSESYYNAIEMVKGQISPVEFLRFLNGDADFVDGCVGGGIDFKVHSNSNLISNDDLYCMVTEALSNIENKIYETFLYIFNSGKEYGQGLAHWEDLGSRNLLYLTESFRKVHNISINYLDDIEKLIKHKNSLIDFFNPKIIKKTNFKLIEEMHLSLTNGLDRNDCLTVNNTSIKICDEIDEFSCKDSQIITNDLEEICDETDDVIDVVNVDGKNYDKLKYVSLNSNYEEDDHMFFNGYLDRYGNFYFCDFEDHYLLAESICYKKFKLEDVTKRFSIGTYLLSPYEEFLHSIGYVKFSNRNIISVNKVGPSGAQIKFIESLFNLIGHRYFTINGNIVSNVDDILMNF